MPPVRRCLFLILFCVLLPFSRSHAFDLSRLDEFFEDLSQSASRKTDLGMDAEGRLQFEKGDIFNLGLSFSGTASYGDDRKLVRGGVRKDDLFGTRMFVGTDIEARRDKDPRYHLTGITPDVYIGNRLDDKTSVTLKLSEEFVNACRIDTDEPAILAMRGSNRTSMLSLIFDRTDLDNKLYPRKGTRGTLTLDWASRMLGSDNEFARLTGEFRAYVTPGKLLTFVSRTQAGIARGYGSGLPFYERFFLGGGNSVRGYRSRMLGPKAGPDSPEGGEAMFLENLEVRCPIYKGLYAAAFLDTGAVWARPSDIDFGGIRSSAGLGLRYVTRFGTAKIDYAVRIGSDDTQPTSRITAGFGMPF
ncbi:MAG: BamA/TamA family outer membrane protein [Deltaproteobacteria bacterium]